MKLFTYALYFEKRKVYIGITNNLEESLSKHKNNNEFFTRIEKTSKLMKASTAKRRFCDQLKRYRYGHEGKNPKYNK